MNYTLIRSKRKTVGIQITKEGNILVRAPYRLAFNEIERILAIKQDWVQQTQERILLEQKRRLNFDPIRAGELFLLGKPYPIKLGHTTFFDGTSFTVESASFDDSKQAIICLYRSLAKNVITERVQLYTAITGFQPASIRITSANTRWGSCSGENRLNFTWKLIFADLSAIDYVVVHELCHIKEHNHSKAFWDLVASFLPDYQKRQKLLKTLQEKLAGEDWD